MKLTSIKIDTRRVALQLLVGVLTYYIDAPDWKWLILPFVFLGIEMEYPRV